MIFKELTSKQFQEYADGHELCSFLQTSNMATLQASKGNRVYYLGVFEGDVLKCATLIIGFKSHFGYYYTSPRGYLIDYSDSALIKFFTNKIVFFLKKNGGYEFNIEPKVFYLERDIDGQLVDNGFNNQRVVDNLLDSGFIHSGFYTELDLNKQVRWAFILEYNNNSEQEVFNNFKATTRNLIRKAQKYHVEVSEVSYDDLANFKAIVDSTGKRKHFDPRPLSYYQTMYKHFHGDGYVKFLIATINLEDLLATLKAEKDDFETKLAKLSDTPSSAGKRKEYEEALTGINKRVSEACTFKEKYGKVLTLAGGMFMTYGNETVYLYSGSYDEFMVYNAQYLIQWEIIKYGINNGFTRHNFYGISGDFSKSNKRWGVYEFKRGFDGRVVEYIGDFSYVLSPLKYSLSKLIKKLRGHNND